MATSMGAIADKVEDKGHESDGSVELLKPTVYVPSPNKTRRTSTATKTNKPKAEKLTDEQLATLQASLFEQSRQKLNPTQVQPEDVMELSPDNIIKHLESELTKAKSRVAQLEGQEAAAVGQAVQAREEKSKVQQTLTNLRKTLLSRDQSIKRLQEKNAKVEAEVQHQKHVIAMLEAQVEELRRYSHGLRYQHAQASDFHNNIISNLQTEVDSLTAMVEEAKVRLHVTFLASTVVSVADVVCRSMSKMIADQPVANAGLLGKANMAWARLKRRT